MTDLVAMFVITLAVAQCLGRERGSESASPATHRQVPGAKPQVKVGF